MFRLDERLKVYLHRAPVDFRLNINGLAALVQHALGLDPFAPCVYDSRQELLWLQAPAIDGRCHRTLLQCARQTRLRAVGS